MAIQVVMLPPPPSRFAKLALEYTRWLCVSLFDMILKIEYVHPGVRWPR